MIEPGDFLERIIDPGLAELWRHSGGLPVVSDEARVLLLAIAMHESGLKHRRQLGKNGKPLKSLARGWWQFESAGVRGVLSHVESMGKASAFCAAACVPDRTADVHEALAWHDGLAVAFARLLLWTDPAPLPAVGDYGESYEYYDRNWRPGKPRAADWPKSYGVALATVRATA